MEIVVCIFIGDLFLSGVATALLLKVGILKVQFLEVYIRQR